MSLEVPFVEITNDEYNELFPHRVKEDAMTTRTTYSFLAQLNYANFVELHSRPNQIIPIELGRASLLLSLINPYTNESFAVLDGESYDGRITLAKRRLFHPGAGHLGVLTEGFLVNGNDPVAADLLKIPKTLDSLATAAQTPSLETFHKIDTTQISR